MFSLFVLSLWVPLGVWRWNYVYVHSVPMCTVFIFILQIPLPVEMVGRDTCTSNQGAVPLPDHALGVLVSW